MINLVNELQISAVHDDVLTVLRNTKRLASKLKVNDILDWLTAEQEGYFSEQTIPDYRKIIASVSMKTIGPIPAGWRMTVEGIVDLPGFGSHPFNFRESISEVQSLISGCHSGNSLYYTVEDDSLKETFFSHVNVHPEYKNSVAFLLKMNETQIKAIPDRIKNKVLDWACELEAAGVKGEGMSFSSEEKRIAHHTTFNIQGGKFEQITGHGDNIRQTSRDGKNVLSLDGPVVQSEGSNNKVGVNKPEKGFASELWGALKKWWTGT